jgi:hypothetical protein
LAHHNTTPAPHISSAPYSAAAADAYSDSQGDGTVEGRVRACEEPRFQYCYQTVPEYRSTILPSWVRERTGAAIGVPAW